MSTRGRTCLSRMVSGSTATRVLEQSTVPLLLVGPSVLSTAMAAQIRIRVAVRTADNVLVGVVHRAVVNLEQYAVTSVVVLGNGALMRDVLVPLEFIESVDRGELELRLTYEQLDQLPDFSWNEFLTPPPSWTALVGTPDGPVLVPASQRKLLGPSDYNITPGTRVFAQDGPIGVVDRVEINRCGQLDALWVRADGILAFDMRIPAEWVRPDEDEGCLRVAARKAEVDAYVGYESRARLRH